MSFSPKRGMYAVATTPYSPNGLDPFGAKTSHK